MTQPQVFSRFNRTSLWAAGLGATAFSAWLVIDRLPTNDGLAAEDITEEVVAEAARSAGLDPRQVSTGAWLVDLIDPQQGEGSSEEELSALMTGFASEMAEHGIHVQVAAAGPYDDGEHIMRVELGAEAIDNETAIEALRGHEWVEGVEPELVYALPQAATTIDGVGEVPIAPHKPVEGRFVPNDPMFGLQWHMEQIHAPEAWTHTRGAGAVVAVIDTGVAWKDAHGVKQVPDLAGTTFTAGETFVTGATPEGLDDHAHGTHVAGTIAQTTHNGLGVTGVANESTIMALKVLSRDGRGSVAGIANAIHYAADHGANVINMSLGGPLPSRVLAKAIEYAHGKGVTVVAAAGNEHRSRVGYPAANKFTIAVGAVDYERTPTFYTNWGKALDVAAPGGDTRRDKNGDGFPDGVLQNSIRIQTPAENDYLWFQGTSMASPHAAGVAALIVAQGVTNPDEVERIMKDTAVHPNGLEWDETYGAGIIDAHAAAVAAKSQQSNERSAFALFGLLGIAGMGAGCTASRARGFVRTLGLAAGGIIGAGALGVPAVASMLASIGLGFGSPLVFSAALPLLAVLLGLGIKPLRPFLIGLSIGYAALLVHGAVVLPNLLTSLPGGTWIDRAWLAMNAAAAFMLARRLSRL